MSQFNDEGNIFLALQAHHKDPKLRIRRAASIYDVCPKKLGRRQKGMQSRRDLTPKSRKLSDLEEQIVVRFILDLDSRGFAPRLRGVEEMVNRLLADRDAPPVGKRWASNLVKRHKDLKTRFFSLVENIIAKYGIRLDEIYYFDETGFLMGMISSGMAVTGSKRRENPKSVHSGSREWITVIQAINAEGRAIQPLINDESSLLRASITSLTGTQKAISQAIEPLRRAKMVGQIMRQASSG
ncbi:hypothetical protein FOXB_03416 [Fusarium oxysporum f. sp. conglutinans Fo5176]|uniref:HTH CENPB-type domain-containing protein n=1 Tax=Fusarium oxysporum (strain Fo5176) TaxID=660025 RepID=F9FAJ0_FUSOF|nr:hypothetical protein FOXB_03416 [Fusarium oxysporum f. sp. conglutinans Fo5176]